MSWLGTPRRYGRLTKLFHWLIVVLFALQFSGGLIMSRIPAKETVLGLTANDLYNWHKSLGLVALLIAVLRLVARRYGRLPNWAKSLSAGERRFIHRAEQVLYATMFVMPISGYVFVMAGGYGVLLFGRWTLFNPLPKLAWLASAAQWVHMLSAIALGATILAHLALVLRHQLLLRDGLLWRMLPESWKPAKHNT
jgi:cytochrome b561